MSAHGLDAESSVTARDGVALVTVSLANPTPVDRVAAVENRLDGDVLPPRTAGVPEPGWDAGGFRGVVAAEGCRVLGFACRAPAVDPPVRVADAGRATGADYPDRTSPAAARRRLGSPRPPTDAVPVPAVDGESGDDADGASSAGDPEPTGDADLPSPVAAWFADVESRLDRAERLGGSVPEATAALADGGGLDEARRVPDRVDADAVHLRAAARRARRLATRAEAVDIPVDALRRLA
jgi:hypothetical protein